MKLGLSLKKVQLKIGSTKIVEILDNKLLQHKISFDVFRDLHYNQRAAFNWRSKGTKHSSLVPSLEAEKITVQTDHEFSNITIHAMLREIVMI